MPAHNGLTYRASGVDIDAGDDLVERIKPLAAATARAGTGAGLGGFGAVFDPKAAGYKDPLLVSATDGVGTKLLIANATNKYDTIGIDLVAMCVNDLVVQGAEPVFFLDYFASSRLSVDTAAEVVTGVAVACKEAGCALVGGETAELPGLYAPGDFDLAGFAVGLVERDAVITGEGIAEGDVLIGLPSNGVHSNGFSMVRKIVEMEGVDYKAPAPFDETALLGETLLAPTKLYVAACLEAIRTGHVRGLAHITGGGLLENIPRVLPENLAVELNRDSWSRPAVFDWLQRSGGVSDTEMYRTFNCGLGMILIVEPAAVDAVLAALSETNCAGQVVGAVTRKGASDPPVVIR